MIKVIASAVGVLVAAFLIYAATRPDTFRVQRTTTIKAPPEKIFPLINDFQRWGAWSPYEKKDPTMKRTLSGAATGKGAVYEWDGNKDVGKGRMEITESAPPSQVTLQLDFIRPFAAHNIVDFTLEAKEGPPKEHRIQPEQAKAELEEGGLTAAVVDEPLPDQYIVVGRLP